MRTWTDRYSAAAGAAVAVLLLVPGLKALLAGLARQADPSGIGAGLALVVLGYAGYLALLRRFGPVAVSAPDAAWRVLSPQPRRRVLRRTAGVLAAVSVAAGLLMGVGLLSAFGAPDRFALRLLTAGVTGVSATTGAMAVAVLAQASPGWEAWLPVIIVVVVAVAVPAVVLGGGPGRPLLVAVAGAPVQALAAVAVAAAGAAAVLVRHAWTALDRVPAHRILDASTRTGNAATAAFLLDPSVLTRIAEDEHWRHRSLRSRPWPTRPPQPMALAWADWRRLSRRPGRAALLAAGAALPAVAAQAGGGLTAPVVVLVAAGAMTAAAQGTAGASRDNDDPALRRLAATGGPALTAARIALPALTGGAWLAAALTGLVLCGALGGGPWWLFGPAAAPVLAAAALRMARRGPVDHAMPLMPTPFGMVSSGPLIWAVTGVDLAVLGCVPVLSALAARPSDLGSSLVAQAAVGVVIAAVWVLRPPRR